MTQAPYRVTVELVGGQSVTFECHGYSFQSVPDENGTVQTAFEYTPLDDDQHRVVYLNTEHVSALTVIRSAEVIEAERAEQATAADT